VSTPGDRPDAARPRGTVGVYDRPAAADRRPRMLRVLVAVVAVVASVAGWWLLGAG